MIYKDNLFNKEIRQSYIDSLSSRGRFIALGCFMALATLVIHEMLQMVYESVLTELVPELMLPSNFTIIYTYNLVAYISFIVFFIMKYDTMTLSEIGENKLYMLSKMGYSSTGIITYKMFTSTFISLLIYALGFALVSAVGLVLKYTFVLEYYLPVFVAGAINVFIVVQLTMVISLYCNSKASARNILLIVLLINEALKFALRYYELIGSKYLMRNVVNLFLPQYSIYSIISVASVVVFPILAYIGAKKKAFNYSVKNEVGGVTLVRYTDNKIISPASGKGQNILSLPAIFAKALLTGLLLASIVFNAFILFASYGSTSKEFSVFGYFPYIFQSNTMEPRIYKNDLALFRAVEPQQQLKVGDTVLFKENTAGAEVSVMNIIAINGSNLTVDITKYPSFYTPGSLKETISRDKVYGIFYDNFRLLGALIVFINTMPGRVVTMVIPVLLLFFNKQIAGLAKRFKKEE